MAGDGYGPGTIAARSEIGIESPCLTWSTQPLNICAVQCFRCGKYRRVPEKRKYEEVREQILSNPWECEFASEWATEEINCDAPDEFTSPEFVLIFDRPSIPASPHRWERKCFLRRECSTNFADVYYYPPNGGPRIKSKKDIIRYCEKFPGSLPPDFDVSRGTSFALPRPPPGLWTRKKPNKVSKIDMCSTMSKNVLVHGAAVNKRCGVISRAEVGACGEGEREEFFGVRPIIDGEQVKETLFPYANLYATEPLPICEQSMMREFSSDEDLYDLHESPISLELCSTSADKFRGIRTFGRTPYGRLLPPASLMRKFSCVDDYYDRHDANEVQSDSPEPSKPPRPASLS